MVLHLALTCENKAKYLADSQNSLEISPKIPKSPEPSLASSATLVPPNNGTITRKILVHTRSDPDPERGREGIVVL